jgi:hypothetical protein
VNASPDRTVIRLRRVIEVLLVVSIVVAYLLVVSRGQILSMLASSPAPTPTVSADSIHSPGPSLGEHTQ